MSQDTKPARRISASRLKSMNDCSMKFYMSDILKLPEKVWPKTLAGSVVHSVLEALRRDKHRAHYDLVLSKGTIYASRAIARLVRIWQERHFMEDKIIADIDPMVMLVLTKTNFMDSGATQTFDPEHEFLLVLPGGGHVKGFIDRMAFYGDEPSRRAKVTDYKSQGKRFTEDEVKDNFQAMTYQLYIYRRFGLFADVEFILLRHPPTSRTPDKHLQTTWAANKEQLLGFEMYLEAMYNLLQRFGPKEAALNYHADEGFCERVCSFRRPMSYLSVKKKTGELVKNYMLDSNPKLCQDEVVETLYCKGCPRFNPQ